MDLRPYLFCLSFYLLYFFLPPFEDNGLPFWVPDVLCQHSEVVYEIYSAFKCSFDEFVGEKVVSQSYSSAILGPPSNFLEEISNLSHSIVFLYFFALITEEGPCYSLELCTQMGISFFSPLPFASLLFSAICKASSDSHFAFLHFLFFRMVLIPASCMMPLTSVHSSSGTLSDLIP